MNSHSIRIRWPSAATCAFLAGGLEIFSFALSQWQIGAIKSANTRPELLMSDQWVIVGVVLLLLFVFGVAAEATALWSVGRRQRSVAPISSRSGQTAVAIYVAVCALTFALVPILGVLQTVSAGGQFLASNKWILHAPRIPVTLAFGCLGWASRGASGARQRWAHRSMLAMAALGIFGIVRLAGPQWLWAPLRSLSPSLAAVDVAARAAAWAVVGAWLRQVNSLHT
jgi:hypothetical protein